MGRNANTINTFSNSNLVVILVSAISKLCFDIKFSEQKLFFSLLPSCTKQSKLAWPIWPWGVLICYEEYNENIFDMINKKCYFGSFKKRLSLRGWSFQWSAQLQELLKLTGMIVGLGFASCMTVAKEKLTDGDGGLVSSFRSLYNLSETYDGASMIHKMHAAQIFSWHLPSVPFLIFLWYFVSLMLLWNSYYCHKLNFMIFCAI